MRDMIIHDTRLRGRPRWGNAIPWQTDRFYRVSQLVQEIVFWSDRSGGINNLKIMCHGWADMDGHLGFGLAVGAEGITPATVGLFNRLRPASGPPKVRFIEIYACGGAAQTAPDREPGRAVLGGFRTPGANGEQLIRDLAINSGAYVKASTHTQYYNINFLGEIDFGAWEGTVLTFNPDGDRIAVENNPPRPS